MNYVVIYKNSSNENVSEFFETEEEASKIYKEKITKYVDCYIAKVVNHYKAPTCIECPRYHNHAFMCYLGRRPSDPICKEYPKIITMDIPYEVCANKKIKQVI